ncbi:hypothetical protein SAMN05444411_106124 [Lutibacter oricola]|uniref:Uncharacterized protein n=1 Tax=Lutibacter oricola TaxID=762486 RepID=A0A1H3CCL6_9FLAO|nr:DUF6095 family protein [Lutibacter oricola]SDX51825.1 hypothetical protein SAMN05444411_106124 [Lutibacter oricola]
MQLITIPMATDRDELTRGLKYELAAFPLLILGPVLITIGFKALKANNNYLWLIAGILVSAGAIVLGFMGIRIILNAFFNKD